MTRSAFLSVYKNSAEDSCFSIGSAEPANSSAKTDWGLYT